MKSRKLEACRVMMGMQMMLLRLVAVMMGMQVEAVNENGPHSGCAVLWKEAWEVMQVQSVYVKEAVCPVVCKEAWKVMQVESVHVMRPECPVVCWRA